MFDVVSIQVKSEAKVSRRSASIGIISLVLAQLVRAIVRQRH